MVFSCSSIYNPIHSDIARPNVAIPGRAFPSEKIRKMQKTWPRFAKLNAESMKFEKTEVFAETWPPEREKREAAGCAAVGELKIASARKDASL